LDDPAMITEPCEVLNIHDGDSVAVSVNGVRVAVRLDQIDAPELRQDYGKTAQRALVKMLAGRSLSLERGPTDKYGRVVGTLWGDHGENINLEIVRAGNAWAYARYVRDPAFTQAEADARAATLGLWSMKRKPMPPWIWRQKHNVGELQNA
jgi:micrococcal nuclease